MKTLLVFGVFAIGLVACSDRGKEPEADLTDGGNPKRSKLTALAESKPGSRSKQPSSQSSPTKTVQDRTAQGDRQVVLPTNIQNDPEALALREEVRQKAAIAREEAEAIRTAERAERVAQMTERFTARLAEMDANADGFLAKEEVSGPMGRRFDESDTNGDGYLDADEQAAIFAAMSERMSAAGGQGRGGRRGFGGGGRGRDRN